eukprot:123677-Prorocentrum_minimum.AAC.1
MFVNPGMPYDLYTFPRPEEEALDLDSWHTVVFQKVTDSLYAFPATLKGFALESGAEVRALPDDLGTRARLVRLTSTSVPLPSTLLPLTSTLVSLTSTLVAPNMHIGAPNVHIGAPDVHLLNERLYLRLRESAP